MKVGWVKSSLQWYNDDIELEIRFTCVNPNNGQRVHITFPLKLVDTYMKMEKFSDTYYNLNLNQFNNNFSRKINGVMFPVLEKKLNTFTQNITNQYINKLDKQINKLDEKITIIDEETIIDEKINNLDEETIIDKKKSNNIKLVKQEIIKNPLIENPMIKEFKKDSDSIINQMKTGMMPRVVDENNFKPNYTFNKRKIYHSEDKVTEILKNTEIKKIRIDNIPKSINLNNLKNTLDSVNFNFVTKEIKNVNYSYGDIDTFLNLNSLIVDTSIIPEYMCCSSVIGPLINMDFSFIEKKINAQDTFYNTLSNDGSLSLITQPHPYDKKIGNALLKNFNHPS
jgi:hypothetical protein